MPSGFVKTFPNFCMMRALFSLRVSKIAAFLTRYCIHVCGVCKSLLCTEVLTSLVDTHIHCFAAGEGGMDANCS